MSNICSSFLDKECFIVSRIGIDTWVIGRGWGPQPENQSLAALHEALEQGCLLIDTAALYDKKRAERPVGQTIKGQGEHVMVFHKSFSSGLSTDTSTGYTH